MAGTFSIRADTRKNRLYLCLTGMLSEEQTKQVADQIIQEGLKLRTGFSVINDISELKPLSPNSLIQIQRAQFSLKKHGVNHVIRIVSPKNITTKMQFVRIGKDAYQSSEIQDSAETLQEAEKILTQANL